MRYLLVFELYFELFCNMKLLRLILIFITVLGWGLTEASAQFYYTGRGSASTRWMQIKTKDYQLLYPQQFQPTALGLAAFMDTIVPQLSYGMPKKIIRTPLIMRTQSMYSNGYVVWAPKRDEMVTSPPTNNYAVPWLKQLAVHEWRHVVQMSTMKRGLTKIATWVFGEGGIGIGLLAVSDWVLEGDATLAETQFSEFGRGVQPGFNIEYRAHALAGTLNFKRVDPWICGSYKRNIPDIYKYGYQVMTAGETYYSPTLWGDILEYSAKWPIFIAPDYFYLRRHHKTSITKLSRRTFAELDAWWKPTFTPNSFQLITAPSKVYTWYEYPMDFPSDIPARTFAATRRRAMYDVMALKHSFDMPGRLVGIDTAPSTPKREKRIAWVDRVSSRPLQQNGALYWTQYKRHPIWEQVSYSQVRSLNLHTGRQSVISRWGRDLFATPFTMDSSTFIAVSSLDDQSNSYIALRGQLADAVLLPNGGNGVRGEKWREVSNFHFDRPTAVHGLAWDGPRQRLCFIALDDRGMWIGGVELNHDLTFGSPKVLLPPTLASMSDLYCRDGVLYFTSIASGKDEVHSLELSTLIERQVTSSTLGSMAGTPSARSSKGANPATSGGLWHTGYTPGGWMVAHSDASPSYSSGHSSSSDHSSIDSSDIVVHSRLPKNILNPPRYKWDVPKIDTMSLMPYTLGAAGDSVTGAGAQKHTPKRYRQGGRQFNVNTWAPVGFDGDYLDYDAPFMIAFGVSAFFQSTMGDMRGYATYGWRNKSNWIKGRFTYTGLPVQLSVVAEYGGGKQLEYGKPNIIADDGTVISAPAPKLDNFLAVGAALSVPLDLSSGAWSMSLYPSFSATYSNARLYSGMLGSLAYDNGFVQYGGTVSWNHTLRSAYQLLRPRWGYQVRVSYSGAFHNSFSHNKSLLAVGYLPGILHTHSTSVRVGYSRQEVNKAYQFSNKPFTPRGVYEPRPAASYFGTGVEYALPVAYPDWGWDGFLYFKRIWVNLHGGYAVGQYKNLGTSGLLTRQSYSYGVDVTVDFNLLRAFSQSITLGFAMPSTSRKLWFTVGYSAGF